MTAFLLRRSTRMDATAPVARSLLMLALSLGGMGSEQLRAASEQLKAGAAARVVNPSKPAATIGHRVMRLFSNVYCDLRVQAMVLEDGRGKRAAWLGCDFCIVHRSVVDRIKAQIQAKHGIEPSAVCVNASHTHSAPPLTKAEAVVPEHFDAQYADFVVQQAVAVVGDAVARLAPARLRYVEDTCKIAYNRRVYDALGRHVRDHCPYPPGVTDPRVQAVVAKTAGDGRMLGMMVKFAGHPVNVVDIGIGSDYPGFMRRVLEQRHPEAVAVFLQGCSGDLVARRPDETMTAFAPASIQMAEDLGRELADAVERALEKPGNPLAGPLEAEFREIQLPVRKLPPEEYGKAAKQNDAFSGAWGKMYSEMLRRGEKLPETWAYRLQAFRFGGRKAPFTLVALDGEVFCEYGLNLRRMLQPAATIVLGYSNGVVTYLPTAKAVRDGGYEPNAFRWWRLPGPFTPESEAMVLEAAAALARPKDRADNSARPAIVLVENGRSNYAIVVAEGAPAPVRFAAEELQKYVVEISGARMPIVADAGGDAAICVGQSKALAADIERLRSDLRARGEDGYLLRSLGTRIVLLGNSPRATLYAAYHFLEKRLGCGWCAPGEDTVPKCSTIRLPALDETVGPPPFPIRKIVLFPYGGQHLNKINLPQTDWLTKNRFNWAHVGANGPYVWERNQSRQRFVPEVERRGLHLQVGGHTFNTWVPPDKYAAAHPEYFAVKPDGVRATDGTDVAHGGLCISNPEVVRTVAENIVSWLKENPEVDVVDLWHNDCDLFCRCPNCTPRRAADTSIHFPYTRIYMKFCNQVAGLVGRRHPGVRVCFLAYSHTTLCPPDPVPLDDAVVAGLCLFPRPSQRTMRPLEASPQNLDAQLRTQLAAWPKVAKNFYVYEYYTFSPEQKIWSMVSMIREDLLYFRRLGIQGISSDQWGPNWYPLNMYAFGKLTWNPGLKPQEIVDEFCTKYYGRAGRTMSAYWSLLEEGLRESWNTEKPVDWRDQKRLVLVTQALSQAESTTIADRIRATAALHKLFLAP